MFNLIHILLFCLKPGGSVISKMKHQELSPQKWQVIFLVWRNLSKSSGNKSGGGHWISKEGGGTIEAGTPKRNLLIYGILKSDVNCWIKWEFTFVVEWTHPQWPNRQTWSKIMQSDIHLATFLQVIWKWCVHSSRLQWHLKSIFQQVKLLMEYPCFCYSRGGTHLADIRRTSQAQGYLQHLTVQRHAHLPRVGNIQLFL